MSDCDNDGGGAPGHSRRGVLECMTWAGAGVLWSIAGGVPYSLGIVGEAMAQGTGGLTFMQISDSHMGFNKPVNPNVAGTLEAAIGRIKAMPVKPSLMIHTGDITHLSQPAQFDDAEQIISQAGLDVHYVPGEHDILDPEVALYGDRHGLNPRTGGGYSFDAAGVHFIGLTNVAASGRFMSRINIDNPGGKAGGLGVIGDEQLAWMKDDLSRHSASTPIVVFAHIPLWSVYPTWGWGTQDGLRALALLRRFGSVTVLNGHIHQVFQKVEGNVTFHTALSTAFPQSAPGTAPGPGPKKIPPEKARAMLGIRTVTYKQGEQRLAIVDAPLRV